MLAWVDLETSGLSPTKDKILEVACIITDDDFRETARFHAVTSEAYSSKPSDMDSVVFEMHTKNGLLAESVARYGQPGVNANEQYLLVMLFRFVADNAIVKETDASGKKTMILPVLAGSTVSFDRSFLTFDDHYLHYRSLDVTSLNETAKRCWPELYAARPQGRKLHRALPDIEDSIATAKFYRDALKPSQCVLKFRTAVGNLMIVGPYSRLSAEEHANELRAGGAADVKVEAVR